MPNDLDNLGLGAPGLPPPDIGQDNPLDKPTETKPITGSTPGERDQIYHSQHVLDKAADLLEAYVAYLQGDNPTPVPPKKNDKGAEGTGQTTGAKGPHGSGNLFFGPNPMVRIQMALLKLYELMRQSNLAQAKYENTTMSLNIAFAKTAASLIIAAGNAEAHMALLEAIAAGVGAAASCASGALSVGAFGKAHYGGQEKIDAQQVKVKEAEAEVGTPSTKDPNNPNRTIEATGKTKEVEIAQAKYNEAHTSLTKAKAKRAELQAEQQSAGVSRQRTRKTAEREQKIQALNREIEDKQHEVGHLKTQLDSKQQELKVAQDHLQNERSKENSLVQNQYMNFNNITQIAGMFNTFLSQGAQAVTKGLSMSAIMDKAQAQAAQQIVDALRENIKLSGQTVSTSMQQMRDAMSALMNDLKQESEMAHHVSLQRGG